MEQYAVPQFIEAEGKIIYFLTFKQFFILVGGGLFSGVFFYILPLKFFFITTIIIMSLAVAIAFAKVKGETIVTLALNFLGFSFGSKNYVWKKKENPYPFKIQKAPDVPNPIEITPLTMQNSKLKSMRLGVETKKIEIK